MPNPRPQLPGRYSDRWRQRIVAAALEHMPEGSRVLDVGGGHRPTLDPESRPKDVIYVGLDPDDHLALGAYDERIRGDIEVRDERLIESFDVVVSWNTFEHVGDLRSAFANIHAYLKPGGAFVTLFAGRWSIFAVVGKLMPHGFRAELTFRITGDDPAHHFPVRYDQCSYSKLARILDSWGEPCVVPLYQGATYFMFSRALRWAYLKYENWAVARPNLATHYLVTARRRPTSLPGIR